MTKSLFIALFLFNPSIPGLILPAVPNGIVRQPAYRSMKYATRNEHAAISWQQEVRRKLLRVLKVRQFVLENTPVPLNARVLSTRAINNYVMHDVEITSSPGRRIQIRVTIPVSAQIHPAVICLAGHGHNRYQLYYRNPYRRFPSVLAERGYVTASVEVGQHTVSQKHHTLTGERLLDLVRTVDYLYSLPKVDKKKIACAGLSLGGEMSMWLGAMDTRIAAVVSSGFLTTMKHLEQNPHCKCWNEAGLRELVDFSDIYSLIAPRPLLLQIGRKEIQSAFPISIAQPGFEEIRTIYGDLNVPGNVSLVAHPDGHVIDLPSLLTFFHKTLPVKNS